MISWTLEVGARSIYRSINWVQASRRHHGQRETMSRRDDSSPAAWLVFRAPWWVSAGLGVAVFIAMRWIFPAVIAGNRIAEGLAQVGIKVAPLAAGFLFFLAALSALIAWLRRRKRNGQPEEPTKVR